MSYLVHFESWTTMFTSKIDGAGCDDLSEKATGFWNDRKTVIITSKVCRKISTYRLRHLKRCCGCIARSDGIFMFIIDSIVVGQTGQTWCKCVVFMRRMRPFKTALKICWFSDLRRKKVIHWWNENRLWNIRYLHYYEHFHNSGTIQLIVFQFRKL